MWRDREPPTGPTLFHRTVGRGATPLVLLHGLGTNGFTWHRWVDLLAEEFRVHVVDLKGFGQSPKPRDGRYSPADQAALLQRWIIENDLEDVTLVGHSLGGGAALLASLELMGQSPPRIRRLAILAGIAYPQPVSIFLRILGRPRTGPLLVRLAPSRFLLRTALRKAYHPSRPVPESCVEEYAENLRTSAGCRALSRSAAQLQAPDALSAIPRYPDLRLPCLLLWGDSDPVVPRWVGERLARELPEARLEILPRCGHMIQEEAPDLSVAAFRSFVEETA